MIESAYYQILEYVIAPLGLMIFTFYVKGENTQDVAGRKLSDNAIESLFIASYSHLLFYFSMSAHEFHSHSETRSDFQFASLLAAIAGLLTIFIYKYFYEKLDGAEFKRLCKHINNTAIGLMVFLIFIIIESNRQSFGYKWTWSPKDAWNILTSVFQSVLNLRNLVFIPFIGLILYIIFFRRPIQISVGLKAFLDSTKTEATQEAIDRLLAIAKDSSTPPEIRYSSYVKITDYYFARKEYAKALEAANTAKQLALTAGYPEDQLIGLRTLKTEIHCLLEQEPEAMIELRELQDSQEKASEKNKPFYDLWIKKLKKVFNRYEIATP